MPGLPVGLMTTRPSGWAMMLPAPLRTTTLLKRAASLRAALRRSFCTSADWMPSKVAASPGCGVNMKGRQGSAFSAFFASRAALMLGFIEMALSASASMTKGLFSDSSPKNDDAPTSPVPMPMANAVMLSSLARTLASRTMISGCRMSSAGRSLSNMPRYTLPGPMCSAARAASTAAPTMPSAPPTMPTLP